jgi:hypothetical protein
MAVDLQSPAEPGFAGLVKGIITDVGTLIRQEIDFARAEFKNDLRNTRAAAAYLATGVGVAALGTFLLALMLVHLLHWAVTPVTADPGSIPLWGCYGIVSAVFLVIGAVLSVVGCNKFPNPLPDETAQTVKENVEWIANSK